MTEEVVNLFEAIEIEEKDRKAPVSPTMRSNSASSFSLKLVRFGSLVRGSW